MTDFLVTFGTILAHTPLWVWPLYALLLALGFQRTRDSTIPLYRALILPLVVALLAISTFVGGGISGLPATLVGLTIGGAAGWRLEREGFTHRLAGGRIWLRGEWWSFCQLLLVLVVRYASAIVSAMYPAIDNDPAWHSGSLLITAALSAIFLGRISRKLHLYAGMMSITA